MKQMKNEYFEIRLESIGGLGANLCGKLLGELGAIYLGLNASSFSSYGSEKRGSPVKANIRWCEPEKELRINSPVQRPDLLGIFHEAMIGRHPVLAGADGHTKVVINTAWEPERMAARISEAGGAFGKLYCIDCQAIAMKWKTRINMVMLGALVKAAGIASLEPVLQLVKDTLGKKYPEALEANLAGVRQGYETAQAYTVETDSSSAKSKETAQHEDTAQGAKAEGSGASAAHWPSDAPRWGYQTAPIGGVITQFGSTVSNDLSASRQGYIPLFHPERCIHCGLCDITCPDMVFQFHEGEYKGRKTRVNGGLDYHHCKGCLRCVNICPVEALTQAEEKDYPDEKKPHFVRNQDLIAEHIDFDCVGANSWINSDSYLNEKRMNGGEV